MFEYEGSEYTLEEVTKAAEDKKLSVEDYVSKFNLKEIKTEEPVEKPSDVVVQDATVTSEPEQASESMELESENGSLDSIDPLDNSKEAILKRRKLNALEEAAIMQQPVELEEVVVKAEAPKPFSYWKDLVLSPEYEEAFEQIQKDTGEFSSTRDRGVLEYLKQFGKAIYAPASKQEDPTYDPINLDLFTRIEIAKNLDKRTLQKAKGGFLNLKEKEQLIKDAKAKVVERSLFTLENDLENTLEEYDKQYDPIKVEAKAVQDRINSTFNFENDKPIIATQASADLYNNLIDKYNVLQEEAKALNEDRNTLIENYETDINALQTEYGIDLASGVVNNNFQLTDEIEEFNKKVSENTGADLTARLMGGLWKTGKDFIFAVPQLAAYATDLFTDQDTYSYFDAWNDVTSNLTNYNTLGEPEASEVVDEEGRYVKDPKEYLRMTADMLPFTLGIIASARKGDLKGAQKILGNVLGGKKGRVYGLNPKLKQNIAMGDAAFKMTVNDNIREGKQQGLSDAQSLAYGTTKSLGTAISQAVMPDINFLKSGAGKSLLTNFRGNLKNATNKKAVSSAAQTFFGNLSKELGEEEIEAVLDLGTKYAFGLGLPDWQGFMKEQKQLVAGTIMLSGSLGSIGATNTFKAVKDQTYKGIIKNQNLLLDQIQLQKNMAIKSGDLEMAEQLNNAEYFTRNIVRAAAVSPENVTAEQLDLVVEKQKLLEKRKKLDPSFRKEVDQEIDIIDEKIANSRVQKSREETQRKIEKGVTKLADELGVVSETVADDDAKLNRLQELRKEGYAIDEKDSTNYGTFLTNKDGDIKLIFNEAANTEDNVITTKAHEMLHAVVLKTVANNPGVAEQLGTSLLEALKTINAEQTTGEYQRRLKSYLKNPELSADESFEEGLTLLSEAMINGDIVYKESIAQKIGRGLEKLFGISGTRAVFNDGKDVFNFIRDYNDSLIKGKVNKSIVATAKEGALGTLTQVDTAAEAKAQPKKAASIRSPRGQEFIGLAQEGILTNENLVETIKSPSSTSEDKFGAIEAVVENNWPVISKAIKFNPTGTIPMEAVKEAVTEQIQGIFPGRGTALFDTYNPETSQVNTFIGSTLGPRQAEILERAQVIGGITQAADITEARGIAAEESATPETDTRETKLIDSRTFGPAADVSIDNIVTIKEGEKPSFRELAEQNLDEVSTKVFNVPGKKIRGNVTLTDGEAKSLQRLFVDPNNVRKLIKTMPPYNVASSETVINEQGETIDVSREFKGKSIGLSTKFINKYYQPVTRAIPGISNPKGRSLGLTTQTQVYELKPEYTGRITNEIVKQIQNDVGVTERGVPNEKISAENRSKYGTTLTGFAKTYLANAINAAGRGKQTTKQEQADTGAGKAKRAASVRDTGLLDVTQARDINAVLKIVGMDSASVPDSKRADIQKAFEDAIKKYKFTTNVFLAGAFAFSGAKYKRKADGNVYYELTNGEEIIGVARRDSEGKIRRNKNGKKLFDQPTAEQVVEQFGEGVKLLPGKGRLYYGVNDPAYQTALAEANKNSEGKNQGKAKRVNINAVNTDKGKAQAKINMQVLEDVVSQLDTAIKKGMPKELAAMVIAQGYQATTGLIKIAAPFKYFSKNLQYGTSLKQKTGDKFREEHNPPASVVGASIIYGFATNNTSQIMADIKKNYYQTKLSKADDQKLDDAKLDATLPVGTTIADNPAIRFIEAGIDLNSIVNYETGQTMAEELGVALKPSDINVQTVFEQNKILKQVLSGDITAKTGQNRLNEIAKLKSIRKASIRNNNENNTIKFSEQVPNQEILDNLGNADEAMSNARNADAPVKKIRVFDFDDTLAQSNSQVLYEMPDGTTGKLNATQFATRAGELEEQGAEFDFAEFSKVIDGKKGPVFKAIENIIAKRGVEDVFILTARPADAAGPIKEFMDALGVNLPIENIVGLGDGKAEAKARWMTSKAAEGYNDFFFVDDAYKNVKAVQDALNVFDVKSKTQQAFRKASTRDNLDKGFNDILEQTTGIASEKTYGKVKAEVAGAGKGRFNFFIPPSAEDFVGLLYSTLGKGKLGDSQMAWYKTHLLNPYARAMNELSSARIALMNDYKQLKKQLKVVPKDLLKKVPGEPYTREQAVRVYIWNTQGMDVPGISKADLKDLTDYVSDNADLQVFADQLIAMQKGDQYAKPKEGWPAGTITTDLLEGLNTTKRTKYLEQWQSNVDVIFSEKNLNKLQAAYGKDYRKALENMLQRMKTGRNRNFSGDTLTGKFTDWITGSIGTIMFFNTRSAVLQTISAVNFVNFTDNNILAAGKAFGNQKQFWSDFLTLANSDFLKERRSGLRMNVNEADIAEMAKKGGVQGVINKLLEFGFTPTQLADSFAIASGGATFYRNRIKTYEKQGLDSKEAQEKAFTDFREIAEESQQSSRPDRISMQQAGSLGRLVLAFANTPAQYARLIKKAASDLKNGRGDAKTNISKIIYYGAVQNLIFNALQQALFAFAFGDTEPEDEEKEKKYVGIANGMMDSLLRGIGLGGAVVSVGKNALKRIYDEMQKKQPKLEKVGYELTKLSPPISAKLSRINQAARSYQWDKKEMAEKGWSLDNPAYLAGANVVSALTNIPLDRAVKKTNNVIQATSQDLETWERMALLGGWSDWEIGIKEENETTKPQPRKIKKRKIKKKIIK